jgi:DNA-binding response OmpR family regulator
MASNAATRSVVLLVGTAKWLAQVLELSGHIVIAEPTGADLPVRLERVSPGVVIVQDVLPDMFGIEGCRLIRECASLDQRVPSSY